MIQIIMCLALRLWGALVKTPHGVQTLVVVLGVETDGFDEAEE